VPDRDQPAGLDRRRGVQRRGFADRGADLDPVLPAAPSHQRPLRDPDPFPAQIDLVRSENVLEVTWEDGSRTVYSGEKLRWACPCAECRGEMGAPGRLDHLGQLSPRSRPSRRWSWSASTPCRSASPAPRNRHLHLPQPPLHGRLRPVGATLASPSCAARYPTRARQASPLRHRCRALLVSDLVYVLQCGHRRSGPVADGRRDLLVSWPGRLRPPTRPGSRSPCPGR